MATSVIGYITSLPEKRQDAILKIRDAINTNIPAWYEETMSYGMIGRVVPHSIYPKGYHCDTSLPLPILNLASQKNHIAFYHMGIYADPKLHDWFIDKYVMLLGKKPDMGKSCIRFKKIEAIPYELLGELAGKMNVEQWVEVYEKSRQGN